MIALKHILVATDFGEASEAALAYGRELARAFAAVLEVVHVIDDLNVRFGEYPSYPALGRLQSESDAAALYSTECVALRGRPSGPARQGCGAHVDVAR